MDAQIAGKMGLGLALLGVSTVMWLSGWFWPWGWVVGGLCFLWGLFTIGDKKSEWENPY